MDFFIPAGVKIAQIDKNFAIDQFGTIRLVEDNKDTKGVKKSFAKYSTLPAPSGHLA